MSETVRPQRCSIEVIERYFQRDVPQNSIAGERGGCLKMKKRLGFKSSFEKMFGAEPLIL